MSKSNKIDLVYVLGKESRWDDNEFRFSLRSVDQNLTGIRNIYLVGEKPEFVKGVKHIPYPDIYGKLNADGNIIRKILRVCREEKLSDMFLLMTDDSFIIYQVSAGSIPYYHKGDLREFSLRPGYFQFNEWRKRLGRTKDLLISNRLTTYHYDCHLPLILDKKLFPEIFRRFDFEKGVGLTWKSIYCNAAGVTGTRVKNTRYTLFLKYSPNEIDQRIMGFPFVSVNDGGLTEDVKEMLIRRFPDKCKYEKAASNG